MQLENKEQLLETYKQIKPIMDNEIRWGNPLLNMLISVAIEKYRKNINKDVNVKDLISFVGYSGIIKIYKNIKPIPGVMNDGNHLIASNEYSALNMIADNDETDYKYFIDEIYKVFLGYKDENIVKKTCRRLDLTYAQLGDKIGVKESTLNKLASTGEISEQIETAIKLYTENQELKEKVQEIETLKRLLKNFFK